MAESSTLRDCDIVMKGGITSGVVYPAAIRELSKAHRFRNIGGASVGAIAAAMTAAAEYGRQTGRGTAFDEFDSIDEELGRDGFMQSLFKPSPKVSGVYSIYLAVTQKAGPIGVIWAVLRNAPWFAIVLIAWWLTLAAVVAVSGHFWWLVPVLLVFWGVIASVLIWATLGRVSLVALSGMVLPLIWPCLTVLPRLGVRAWRDVSTNGFGLVPGSSEDGSALCDWLHRHIQKAAGLGEDEPLTFGMLLNGQGIDGAPTRVDLQMTTTNLSTGRPMRVPRDLDGYAFVPTDLQDALPNTVTRWLTAQGTAEAPGFRLPTREKIPVLLGFRLSLSFPLLFTGVRLYSPALETKSSDPVAHWFSDGGIASNFPVHFFDAWMPRRPTFALSFAPLPVDPEGRLLPGESDVGLPPRAGEPRLPRWVNISGIGGFFGQMLDTMQNWRDALQSELPGFSDRVYEARLDKGAGEGGLNLAMDAATIARLRDRGRRVAIAIDRTFDWDQHFFTRYLLAMQQLEQGLVGGATPTSSPPDRGLLETFGERRGLFAAGDVGAADLFGHEIAWLEPAGAATWELIESAQAWAAFGRYVGDRPRPQPIMRLVPEV